MLWSVSSSLTCRTYIKIRKYFLLWKLNKWHHNLTIQPPEESNLVSKHTDFKEKMNSKEVGQLDMTCSLIHIAEKKFGYVMD